MSWRYKSDLQAGVSAERWTDIELDAASTSVEAPRWTWIPIIVYITFMVLWFVSLFKTGFPTLGWIIPWSYVRIIDSL